MTCELRRAARSTIVCGWLVKPMRTFGRHRSARLVAMPRPLGNVHDAVGDARVHLAAAAPRRARRSARASAPIVRSGSGRRGCRRSARPRAAARPRSVRRSPVTVTDWPPSRAVSAAAAAPRGPAGTGGSEEWHRAPPLGRRNRPGAGGQRRESGLQPVAGPEDPPDDRRGRAAGSRRVAARLMSDARRPRCRRSSSGSR